MAFDATIVRLMLASPSDVDEERSKARAIISEWNDIHAQTKGMVLLPLGWESHSSPELSGRPQEIINNRILKDADVLIGIFWSRLGSPTGDFSSGTVEEIEKHTRAGKPALIYFSDKPIEPSKLDAEQYSALRSFREQCEKRGLIQTFSSVTDFETKFRKQLQIFLNSFEPVQANTPQKNSAPSEPDIRSGVDRSAPNQSLPTVSRPTVSAQVNRNTLSSNAKTILVEASKTDDGMIYIRHWIGGQQISTSKVNFFDEKAPRREIAEWENGLNQLENNKFIERQSESLYVITSSGYRVADLLLSATGDPDVLINN